MGIFDKRSLGSVLAFVIMAASAPALAQDQGGGGGAGADDAARQAAAHREARQNDQRADRNERTRELQTRNLVGEPLAENRSYNDAMAIAGCLRTNAGVEADALIGGYGTEDPQMGALAKALDGQYKTCLKGTSGTLPMMVGASLAELSLESRSLTLEPRAMSLDSDRADAFITPADGKATLDTIGRCTAVFSPGLSYAVLETKIGSPEELAALDALYKGTPECGLSARPEKIPVYMQRASIANGLYRWLGMQG